MSTATQSGAFRVCPTTGLKVHKDADALIKANAVVATVALLIGGIAAILVLLTRWQAVHLLDAVWFYRVLTIHGMNMLIFFILFFEMAVLYFASAVLLNSRVAAPKVAWVAFTKSASLMPRTLLKTCKGGIVASPTPMVPMSSDSTRVILI